MVLWFLAESQRRLVFFPALYFLLKTAALAPIEVEILLLFSLKSKRLERIAGIAPNSYITNLKSKSQIPNNGGLILNPTGFENLSGSLAKKLLLYIIVEICAYIVLLNRTYIR